MNREERARYDAAKARFADPDFQDRLGRRKLEDLLAGSMSPSEIFAMRLRQSRQDNGLTQAALAGQLRRDGVPMSTTALLRIESTERKVSLDEALALTDALNAVPAYMLTPPDDKMIRLNHAHALGGGHLLEWIRYGPQLPPRLRQEPPTPESKAAKRRATQRLAEQAKFVEELTVLGQTVVSAIRAKDWEGLARAAAAIEATTRSAISEQSPAR